MLLTVRCDLCSIWYPLQRNGQETEILENMRKNRVVGIFV